jgi:hypothetical protein
MPWTDSLSVKGCQALLRHKGVDITHVVEKKELIMLVQQHLSGRSEADLILAEVVKEAVGASRTAEDAAKYGSKPHAKVQAPTKKCKDVDQIADNLIDMLLNRPADFKAVLCSQSAFKMIRGSVSIVSIQVDILRGLAQSNRQMMKIVFTHGVRMSRTMADAFKIVQSVTGGRGKYVVVLVALLVTFVYVWITWLLTMSMIKFVNGPSGGAAKLSGLGDLGDLDLAEQVYAYSSSSLEQPAKPLSHGDEWDEF